MKPLTVKKLTADVADAYDVRTAQSIYAVFEGAELLIKETSGNLQHLLDLEKKMSDNPHSFSPLSHLITKAAISKLHLLALKSPIHVELVVPMYHEVIRISPRANSTTSLLKNSFAPNKDGEDALLRKYIEMEWLVKDTQLTYNLLFVDDMCDQNSGKNAQKIIKENNLKTCAVYFLENYLDKVVPGTLHYHAIETIIEKRQSIRGGALCLGFAEALSNIKHNGKEKYSLIGYVDTDSSYSLTQLGNPIYKIINSKVAKAVTASRQHPLTYMESQKTETNTSQRSSGLIRLKQTVGYLRRFVLSEEVPADTQSGFKLFRPEVFEATLRQPNKAFNFSYDTQLLSRIHRLYGNGSIVTFGVVCIDCDELSTANTGATYFNALKIILDIAEEMKFDSKGYEMWLLDYLTKNLDNYHMFIRLLDDSTDLTEWFPKGSEFYILALDLRNRIKTDRDTTAVGSYFTSDICLLLVQVLQEIENLKEVENDGGYFYS